MPPDVSTARSAGRTRRPECTPARCRQPPGDCQGTAVTLSGPGRRAACSAGTCSSRWNSATTTAASAAATVATRKAAFAPETSTILPATEAPMATPRPERRPDPGERLGHHRPRHEQLGEGERADQRRRDGHPGEDDERDHDPDVVDQQQRDAAARSAGPARRPAGGAAAAASARCPTRCRWPSSPTRQPGDEDAGHRHGAHLVGERRPARSPACRGSRPPTAPTTNSTRRPGVRIADGPLRLSWPPGGGSVRRCAANSRLPTVARVNAVTTPLVACPVVDRKVTSTGPTMKTNSSTTDSIASAVGSRWLPRSRCVQRTRIIDETGGMQAPGDAGGGEHRPQRPVRPSPPTRKQAPQTTKIAEHREQHASLTAGCRPAGRSAGRPARS